MRTFPSRRLIASAMAAGLVVVAALSAGAPAAFAANDPLFAQQWALGKVGAEASWARSTGDGVIVAVVDTGVNFDHEDLRGASAGSFTCLRRCVPGNGDVHGHGTWVSGIIAARANNGVGIAGVAPNARILSIRILDKTGTGDIADVARAIRFATERGARVINLSLGSDLPISIVLNLLDGLLGSENPFQAAINYATGQGALVVAAAGNSGLTSGFAGFANLLLVGATGPNDQITGYSSSLVGVTLHAPGGEAGAKCDESHCIVTTDKDGAYKSVQGTSFAAPHVSGVAAQLIAMGFSPVDAAARILAAADATHGVRRLNAANAVQGDPGVKVARRAAPIPPVHLPSPTGLANRLGLGLNSDGTSAPAPQPAPREAAPAETQAATAPQADPDGTVAGARPPRGVPAGWAVGLVEGRRRTQGTAPATAARPQPAPRVPPAVLAFTALFLVLAAAVVHRCVTLRRTPAPPART